MPAILYVPGRVKISGIRLSRPRAQNTGHGRPPQLRSLFRDFLRQQGLAVGLTGDTQVSYMSIHGVAYLELNLHAIFTTSNTMVI